MRLLLSGLLLLAFPGPPLDAAAPSAKGDFMLTDFSSAGSDLGWYVVNDNVMGGSSEGDFEQEQGHLRFAGRTDTNGGGFSSIRTKPLQLDLSSRSGIKLKVKGDGRRYTWRLTTDANWRGGKIGYWANFDTSNGRWSTVNIPFSSFLPKVRGRQLDGPPLDPGRITGMGLMIYDQRDGPFELYLASVEAYSAQAPFTLIQYRWENRILVVSAPSEDDGNLREQQREIQSAPQEFADRDLVLITLLDDAVSKADNRELTSEEVSAARTALNIRRGSFALRLIGKDGSVKLARETATSLAEIYTLIDSMPMRQREKPERFQ